MTSKMNHGIMTCAFHISVILVVACAVSNDQPVEDTSEAGADAYTPESNVVPATLNMDKVPSMPETLAKAMEKFQIAAQLANKQVLNGILPLEETNKQYSKMALILEEILDHMYTDDNVYSFLKAKGLHVIISPNIHIDNPELRSGLLQLIKALFKIAPTTTVTMIPITILDELVDILEKDKDVFIKTYVIEILTIWLPGNIDAQTRVMIMKGFEPFYKQLSKIEHTLTKITLELFNTILDEHIRMRSKKMQRNKADYTTLQLYQRIGLIERMSTPMMCNGFLEIFKNIFSYGTPMELPPVIKLLQTIKPYCFKVYSGKSDAIALINQVLKYMKEPTRRMDLEERGIDVTEAETGLTNFAEMIKFKAHSDL